MTTQHSTSSLPSHSTVAVILCAGQGRRMGAAQNKVFLPLAGKPLLLYTIAAFQQALSVDALLLVAHPDEVNYCRSEIVERYQIADVLAVIAGGATRHQSEDCALAYLRSRIESGEVDVLLFHDGARPFVTPDEIDLLTLAARATGGALLGTHVEAQEIVAEVTTNGTISAILLTHDLWRAQTPQAFTARPLLAAYDQARAAGFEGTDTSSTYERDGSHVQMVEGSSDNIKVTTPEDLVRGEAILHNRGR